MGADLYIKPIQQPAYDKWKPKFEEAVALRDAAQDEIAKEAAQKLVIEAYDAMFPEDGYFRDSYNATGILSRIGLSWWRDLEYDITDEDSENNVSAEACARFLAKVRASGPPSKATRKELESRHAKIDDGENSVESWNKFYADKYDRLVSFLERAIAHGGMRAST